MTEGFALTKQDEQLAFKPEATSLARLAETMVAFANGGGGTLLIGVHAKGRTPSGLADPEGALDRALKAALSVAPPLIIPLPRLELVDGRSILVVDVPHGLPHVYSYKGTYFVRDGLRNLPLDPRRLRRLMLERGPVSFGALVPDGACIDDIDWELAEHYWTSLATRSVSSAQEALHRRGCLVAQSGATRPTYAGLLLFGREPQQWLLSSEILVARYAGTVMDDRFIKEEIRGTLADQIRKAEAFVVGNMRRGVHLSGLERTEATEYPVEAVREAIVNAVAHRDYRIRGDEIRILQFSDRIEIYSPGRLPGHVSLANLVEERFSRNETVVQVLSDMGFIERLGYGIDRMIQKMARAGLPQPRFEETASGFKVTLVGHGAALIDDHAGGRWWRLLDLNQRQDRALAHLADKGRITNRDYQKLCPDVSPETLRRDLQDLVRKNLLLKIGDKRATYYIFK
ncbi:ATP-binding protein [Chloroflexota bacterium]